MKNPVQARHILISHMNKNSMILPPLYMLVGSIYICGSISDVMQIKITHCIWIFRIFYLQWVERETLPLTSVEVCKKQRKNI